MSDKEDLVQATTERAERASRSPEGRSLGRWEGYASVEQLNPDDLKLVIQLILDRMGVDLICESTPDYTSYELREQAKP